MRCLASVLALLLAGATWAEDAGTKAVIRFDQKLGEQAPLDLTFRDEDNHSVRLDAYFGDRPVILVLAYFRCPRLCSVVLQGMVDSLKQITLVPNKDFQVVVVSIDPREGPSLARAKRDSCLEAYGDTSTIDGWHFLTGREESIRRLADAVGFGYVFEPATDMYRHSAGIMVLTPGGKVARYFFGMNYPPNGLRLGLVEASAGKVGTAVDDVVLFTCFAYDPESGAYLISPMKLMRLGAIVTVLVLGVYLGRAWWKRTPDRA